MKGIGYIRTKIDLATLVIHQATKIYKRVSLGLDPIVIEVTNPRELSRIRAYQFKEPNTISWIKNLKSGDVMYDIGANTGLYSIFAAMLLNGNGHVYSFEPESQNFASLNRNIKINELSTSITSLCIALTETTHLGNFFVRGNLRAGEAIHQFGNPTDDKGDLFKPVHQQGIIGISMDDLCYKYKMDFPTHLKIDVDGHEAKVISGASKVLRDERLKSILIELTYVPSRPHDAAAIYESIENSGFILKDKTPTGSINSQSNNAIFVRSESS